MRKAICPKAMVPVVVTTSHGFTYFGYTSDVNADPIHLEKARCAIYWGTTLGVAELADTGPTGTTKIGAPSDVLLHGVGSVHRCSTIAEAAWNCRK